MTVLYLDESNNSVCIYDAGSKMLWRALPENNKEKATVISVTVLYNGTEYVLNSQDDSVAKKLSTSEIGDNNVKINYGFDESLKNGAKIKFNVPLVISAQDGSMSVEIDCEEMNESNKGNTIIKSISLLESFGADKTGEKDDYLFIPDGCGAIVSKETNPEKFNPISLPVYKNGEVVIPAFGIKTGNGAFVSLVEQGDSIATIKAEKALSTGGFNKAFSSFEITETKTENNEITISGNSYNDRIKVSYRFLSDDTANYVGMASACRELLIRNGVLDLQEQNSDDGVLPLNLTIIGSAKFAKPGKGNTATKNTLTNFEQALDMLSYIRSKGIGSINVKYDGIFKGNSRLSAVFSKKKALNDLLAFSRNQNIRIYPSIELLSASDLSSKAVSIDSGPIEISTEKVLSNVFSATENKFLQPGRKIEKHSSKLLSSMRKYDFDGVCLSDVGKLVYSDNSKNNAETIQQTKNIIAEQINAFSSSKKLMVSGANIYSLKYAGVVTDVPTSAVCEKKKQCRAIPFLQILLHGYTDYSPVAFNLENDSETAFLKAVEYGCVPAYDLYFADFGTDEIRDNYYYENYTSEMQTYYDRMSNALSDLRDKKITAHYEVKKGVFCTEYGSSTIIYVNYNNRDVRVNGAIVEAKSFIRM